MYSLLLVIEKLYVYSGSKLQRGVLNAFFELPAIWKNYHFQEEWVAKHLAESPVTTREASGT